MRDKAAHARPKPGVAGSNQSTYQAATNQSPWHEFCSELLSQIGKTESRSIEKRFIVTQNYSTGCFMAGLAIGIGIGMLMAPSSGADAREYIRDRARDWKDRAEEIVDEGKSYIQRQGRHTGESVERARHAYQEPRS